MMGDNGGVILPGNFYIIYLFIWLAIVFPYPDLA